MRRKSMLNTDQITQDTLFKTNGLKPHWQRLGESETKQYNFFHTKMLANISKLQTRDGVIFSGENISLLSAEELSKMKIFFTERIDARFKIILFIREPVSWTASMVQENIKHGQPNIRASEEHRLSRRISNLREVFGDDVLLFEYEE